MAWSNFKSHFTKRDRLEEERMNLLVDRFNISGEYISTLKTKSYTEMWKKAHLGPTSRLERLGSSSSSSSSSSSVRLPVYQFDNLLEPRQETLLEMIESSDLHPLIGDFVDATFEASKICELLIRNIAQVRANYHMIQRVIKLAKNTLSHPNETRSFIPESLIRVTKNRQTNDIEFQTCADHTNDQCHAILKDLALFAMLKNPLVSISPSKFRDMHDSQGHLLRNLSIKCRKMKSRRAKFTTCCKKAVVLACSLGFVHKGKNMTKRRRKSRSRERLVAQLEVARKGVYFLMYDFDTMSSLARRLQDEIEHIINLSDVCVRSGKMGVVKEIVREFGIDQKGFLEKLEELEKEIFLCFLNINRSRMLLVHEIMLLQQEHR